MCLIAIAHRASPRYRLAIAANRDEDYQRPSHDAHVWHDAPRVIGGRDGLHDGSWLAVTREGRFAAVTNLRGATPRSRSRGALVRDFVTGDEPALAFARNLDVEAYAGFHLLLGDDEDVVYLSREARVLAPGIYGVSNAPEGEHWPKERVAVEAMEQALRADDPAGELLAFLSTPRHINHVEDEVFIAGDRYGTRSSTVVLLTDDELLFTEQTFTQGGVALGERRQFRVSRVSADAR